MVHVYHFASHSIVTIIQVHACTLSIMILLKTISVIARVFFLKLYKQQSALVNYFPVEAGYFNSDDKVIPTCPVKRSLFGIQKSNSDEKVFQKELNKYLKSFPDLPDSIVKSEMVQRFFNMRSQDTGQGA